MVISHMTKVPTPRRRPGARSIHSGANSSVGHGLQDAARDLPGYGDSPWSLRWTHPGAAVHVRALSQGVSFHDAATVREEQLMEFENWLADHPTGQVRADRDTLVRARSTPGRELLCHGRRSRPEDWPERLTKADRGGAGSSPAGASERPARCPVFLRVLTKAHGRVLWGFWGGFCVATVPPPVDRVEGRATGEFPALLNCSGFKGRLVGSRPDGLSLLLTAVGPSLHWAGVIWRAVLALPASSATARPSYGNVPRVLRSGA